MNPCFPLDKRYAAVSGKHTKIDPEWPIAEVFIYESDYDDECQNRRNAVSAPITADCDVRGQVNYSRASRGVTNKRQGVISAS